MPTFTVHAINKATGQPVQLSVSNQKSLEDAQQFVLKMPGAAGGGHPGFELPTEGDAPKSIEVPPPANTPGLADLVGKAIAVAVNEAEKAA